MRSLVAKEGSLHWTSYSVKVVWARPLSRKALTTRRVDVLERWCVRFGFVNLAVFNANLKNLAWFDLESKFLISLVLYTCPQVDTSYVGQKGTPYC